MDSLYTIYDPIHNETWMCCIPDEAIPKMIKRIERDTNKIGVLGVRKTTEEDIVQEVPQYEPGDLFDKKG